MPVNSTVRSNRYYLLNIIQASLYDLLTKQKTEYTLKTIKIESNFADE